jgi:stage V sporulation protein S
VETLKVSAHSKSKSLAGALAAVIRTEGKVELQAIGAGAVNQAIKAIAIARGYVAPNGINLVVIPSFVEISIDNEERTAIKFTVEPR